jgi:hypothetical protein
MKRALAVAITALAVGLSPGPVASEATIYTLGSVSCGAWSADRKAGNLQGVADEYWVGGFLSGVNWSTGQRLGITVDGPGLYGFIDNYCTSHPSRDLSNAAGALVNLLAKYGQ